MKRCLHQMIRPSRKDLSKREGIGECVECEYDLEKNKTCKKYTPVTIITIDIKEQTIKKNKSVNR